MDSRVPRIDEPIETVSEKTSRPLWPWVVGTICVSAAALAFAFWWPMYRANRVLKQLAESHSRYEIDYHHPGWTEFFLDGQTFHPWFDELYSIDAERLPATEQLLDDFSRFRDLKELTIQLGAAPLEKFGELESLETLCLVGNHQPQAYIELPASAFYRGKQRSLTRLNAEDWKRLISELHVKQLILLGFDVHGCEVPNSNIERLIFSRCDIEESAGEAIAGLNSLERFALFDAISEPSFWQKIAQHPTLSELTVIESPLSGETWKAICRVECLKELVLYFPWDRTKVLHDIPFNQLKPPFQPAGSCPIGPEWNHLTGLKNLKVLALRNSPISEDTTQAIAALPNLRVVGFQNVSINESTLQKLGNSASLASIDIYNTGVSREELRMFMQQHPNLRVEHDYSREERERIPIGE